MWGYAQQPIIMSTFVCLAIEEARSLIPKSSGDGDTDHAGKLARRAMRDLAYEARKFSLGYGVIHLFFINYS